MMQTLNPVLRLSPRFQKAIELFALLFLYFNTFWHLVYFEKSSYAVFFSYFLLITVFASSVFRHREGLRAWGIRLDNFRESLRSVAIPFGVIVLACVAFVAWRKIPLQWPALKKILEFPAAGFLQQLLFQGYFYNRFETVFRKRWIAILLTALTFALFHLPNKRLMSVTLLGGLYLSYFFSRHRNLFVAGLLHGWISLALTFTLEPAGMIKNYKVGPEPLGPIRQVINDSMKPETRVGAFTSSSIPASFYQHFGRTVETLQNEKEIEAFLKSEKPGLLVIPKNVYEDFEAHRPTSSSYVWKESLVWKRKFPHRRSQTLKCVLTLNFRKLHELYRREVYLVGNRQKSV